MRRGPKFFIIVQALVAFLLIGGVPFAQAENAGHSAGNDQTLTIAEFLALANEVLGSSEEETDTGDLHVVSRAEAAVLTASLLHLELSEEEAGAPYSDAVGLSPRALGSIRALADLRIVKGYPDGKYKPFRPITRSEAATMLGLASKTGLTGDRVYDQAGSYGPESGTEIVYGNVIVSGPSVKLRNMNVKGNIVLTAGIGEGDVKIDRVTASGNVLVNGGGTVPIVIKDCSFEDAIVDAPKMKIRIAMEGAIEIERLAIESSVVLDTTAMNEEGMIVDLLLKDVATVIGRGRIGHASIKEGAEESTFEIHARDAP
ncbi:S-layer homology domain-containing protein [Cohnella suwonensis]|uniref:S-layer homology domain-containing protein n=1 Tax=Cohnella suwonensis TaxID=696072 RepID=A0ABW0LRI2_9BACL